MADGVRLICILGPTASGKSALAYEVAKHLGGEVVNADSMQVFKGLSVATGVPPASWMEEVPHHLYQVLEPYEAPDAMWWASEASRVIREISSRGHVPLVVGGTFFWVRALLEGLAEVPKVPPEVRAEVLEDLRKKGPEGLYRELEFVDPKSAARLRPTDSQRIARAIEVFRATGTPLSSFHALGSRPVLQATALKIVLMWPRAELYRRINLRAAEMLAGGAVEEVKSLLEGGIPPSVRPLRSATLGPIVAYLQGRIDRETMAAEVAKAHRRYAKRQLTWLRGEKGLIEVDASRTGPILEEIARFISSR